MESQREESEEDGDREDSKPKPVLKESAGAQKLPLKSREVLAVCTLFLFFKNETQSSKEMIQPFVFEKHIFELSIVNLEIAWDRGWGGVGEVVGVGLFMCDINCLSSLASVYHHFVLFCLLHLVMSLV